jgi:hypothetical protein
VRGRFGLSLAGNANARKRLTTATRHHIHVEQPQLVIDAICEVVDAVRSGAGSQRAEATVRSTNGGVAVYPPKAAPDHLNGIKPAYLRPKEAAPAAPPSSGGPCVLRCPRAGGE